MTKRERKFYIKFREWSSSANRSWGFQARTLGPCFVGIESKVHSVASSYLRHFPENLLASKGTNVVEWPKQFFAPCDLACCNFSLSKISSE